MSRDDLAPRETRFLAVLDRGVYALPESPYRKLLDHAGIAVADVRKMAGKDGLEATLEQLFDAGGHVGLDEFKGRAPLRRGSLVLQGPGTPCGVWGGVRGARRRKSASGSLAWMIPRP